MSTYPPITLINAGVYTREGAMTWWRAVNHNLCDRRPCDLWWRGTESLSALWDDASRALVLDEVSRLTEANA